MEAADHKTPDEKRFVRRDAEGRIQSVSLQADEWHQQALPAQCDELLGFAQRMAASSNPMVATDLGLARVLEDVIDLLVAKQVLRYTDLPTEARSKLQARRELRGSMRSLNLLGDEDDVI